MRAPVYRYDDFYYGVKSLKKGNPVIEKKIKKKLSKYYSEEEIEIWLEQPHNLLRNQSPLNLIQAGRATEVLNLVNEVFNYETDYAR